MAGPPKRRGGRENFPPLDGPVNTTFKTLSAADALNRYTVASADNTIHRAVDGHVLGGSV